MQIYFKMMTIPQLPQPPIFQKSTFSLNSRTDKRYFVRSVYFFFFLRKFLCQWYVFGDTFGIPQTKKRSGESEGTGENSRTWKTNRARETEGNRTSEGNWEKGVGEDKWVGETEGVRENSNSGTPTPRTGKDQKAGVGSQRKKRGPGARGDEKETLHRFQVWLFSESECHYINVCVCVFVLYLRMNKYHLLMLFFIYLRIFNH